MAPNERKTYKRYTDIKPTGWVEPAIGYGSLTAAVWRQEGLEKRMTVVQCGNCKVWFEILPPVVARGSSSETCPRCGNNVGSLDVPQS